MCDIIPVCFIVDENLIYQLKPVVNSLIRNVSMPIHVCVLTNKAANISIITSTLHSLLPSSRTTVCTITPEHKSLLEHVYIPEERVDITWFGYAQLVIPYYFSEFPKLFFMEPDQIVQHDLKNMWESVFSENILLGAANYGIGSHTINTLQQLYGGGNAYNCGVMLVDTHNWIHNNYTSLCIDAALKQKTCGTYYNYYAEGAINIALQPFIVEMDPVFNYCNLGWLEDIPANILSNMVILHWNGPRKPWKSDGLYKSYYMPYVIQ